jgi:MFS family permease
MPAEEEDRPSLTRGEVNRAMRGFITASGLWGVWGQTIGIGTAVFTGYVLHLGADESYIALLTSVAYLLAAVQVLSSAWASRIRRRKHLVVGVGFVEIVLRNALPLIPLLFAAHLRLEALAFLVAAGLLCGHVLAPFYNTWVANTVPENIRARFTSRQTILSTIAAMIAGVVVGRFIDGFDTADKQTGFDIVFVFGAIFGLLGYLALSRAPHPVLPPPDEPTPERTAGLLAPLRDRNFRRAVLFYGTWTFAIGIGGPLYSVFMLVELGISYTWISIFNALFMMTSIAGYRFWAGLVDRFGSKPVLQILMIPATFIPIIWVFNSPEFFWFVPIALCVSGLIFSGILVAVTPLLYGLVPTGSQRPHFLATWSASVNLLGALGPAASAVLVHYLHGVTWQIHGLTIGHLQIIFLISAACRIPALFLLSRVSDRSSITSRHLLSHLSRGNLLSYTYNTAVYNVASREERRARAALGLGRSGSPLAIEQLIQALADASPMVRRSAARALGDTGSEAATESLVKELVDGASDIRSEAAEALGRLGHAGGVDPLIEALDDEDPRVRISAIRGLSEIGGAEVQELLFWHFGGSFDPVTFPTLVDVLAHMSDHRVIKATLLHLQDFRSPAVRLQLLNSVCVAIGQGGEFYRLLSVDEDRRSMTLLRIIRRAGMTLQRSAGIEASTREVLDESFDRLRRAYDSGNIEWLEEAAKQVAGIIRDGLLATGRRPYEVLSIYLVILALEDFLTSQARMDLDAAREIFVAVALQRLSQLVGGLESNDDA